MKKSDLRAAILEQLRRDLALQISAAQLSRDEAISEESRAESKYDTHGQEAAYLAEGQARLAAEIETSLMLYTTLELPDFDSNGAVAVGAIVEVSDGARSIRYFLGPRAGGLELRLDGHDILVLTPQSPLGHQLIGKRVGDGVQTAGRNAARVQRIVAIS